MPLLRPRSERPATRLAVRNQGFRECPYNGNQIGPCLALCVPRNGMGPCGYPAAHAIKGRTQLAILAQKRLETTAVR